MVLNPVSLTRKTPLLCRFVGFTHSPISQFSYKTRIPINAVQKSGFRAASLCLGNGDSGSRCLFKCSLPFTVEDRQLRFDRFRLFSVSGGGSGGGGDGKGGFGGGNSGGGDGGDGAGGNGSWSFVLWYLGLLAKYPVLTKAVTSAILTLFGDLICQLVIDQVSSLDSKRTFLFTFLGMVLVGPTLHFWYLYLSKLVTMPGASGAFLRLILDQFLFAPMFIGLFMSTLLTLEGRPSQVVPKLQQEWFSAVLANWQLWIPFQFLNFRFVPQQFQVLAANAVALAWNVILSFKAHKEVLAK